MRRLAFELIALLGLATLLAVVVTRRIVPPWFPRLSAALTLALPPVLAAPVPIPEVTADATASRPPLRDGPVASAHETVRLEHREREVQIDLRGVHDASELLRDLQVIAVDPAHGGGYRITARDATGALADAGVDVGDVLVAINGTPTRDADGLMQAYAAVRFAPSITLRFLRGAHTYDVRASFVR